MKPINKRDIKNWKAMIWIVIAFLINSVRCDALEDLQTWFLPAGTGGFGYTTDKYIIIFIVGGLAILYTICMIILMVCNLGACFLFCIRKSKKPRAIQLIGILLGVTTVPGCLMSSRRLTVLWGTLIAILTFNAFTYVRSGTDNPPVYYIVGPIAGIVSWIVSIFLSYLFYTFKQPFDRHYDAINRKKRTKTPKKTKKTIIETKDDGTKVVTQIETIEMQDQPQSQPQSQKKSHKEVISHPHEPKTHAPLPNQIEDGEEMREVTDRQSHEDIMNEAEHNPYMSTKKSEHKTQEQAVDGADPTERDQSEFTFDSKGDNSFHDSEEEDEHDDDTTTLSTVESAVTVNYEDEHKEEFQMYHNHNSMQMAGEEDIGTKDEIVHFAEDMVVSAVTHTPYHDMSFAKACFCGIYGLFLAFPIATTIYLGVGAGGAYLIYTYMTWMGRYGLISFCGLWIINYMIGVAGFIARGQVYGQPSLIKKILYVAATLIAAFIGVLAIVGLFLLWWYKRTWVEYMDAYLYSTAILVGVFILLSIYVCVAVFCFIPACLRIHWGLSAIGYTIASLIISIMSVLACFQGLAMGSMGDTVRNNFLYATAIGWGQHIVIDNIIIIISRIFLFSSIGASFALVQK